MQHFQAELSNYVKSKDLRGANNLIMRELAKSLVKSKADFVDLLMYSGIPADISMSDIKLIDEYVDNVDRNEKLLIGSAFLVNKNNQVTSFDGDVEISDKAVKGTIYILNSYFDNSPTPESDPNEDFYATSNIRPEDDYYDADGGKLGAIAKITEAVGGVTGKVLEGQNKKKYGATDLATKKFEAKQQITSQLMEARKAEIDAKMKSQENKAKTSKTLMIVGGSILGLIVIGAIIYAVKKSNK